MSFPARLRLLSSAVAGIGWLSIAAVAYAADPTPSAGPSATPAVSAAYNDLVATNTAVGQELVWWGLRLLIISFVWLAIVGVVAFARALMQRPTAVQLAAGGLNLTELLASTLRLVGDLIKTPAGIGALLLIFGVLMLLGTAAIDTRQLSDVPSGVTVSEPPSLPPSESPVSPPPSGSPMPQGHASPVGGSPSESPAS